MSPIGNKEAREGLEYLLERLDDSAAGLADEITLAISSGNSELTDLDSGEGVYRNVRELSDAEALRTALDVMRGHLLDFPQVVNATISNLGPVLAKSPQKLAGIAIELPGLPGESQKPEDLFEFVSCAREDIDDLARRFELAYALVEGSQGRSDDDPR
jgi:hypothetical protein